jgi:radical SAM superfamily enzyme YgiQ (UPF0313 family)
MYRKGKEIIWNREENFVDLNCLPIPDFDSFFKELNNSSEEVKQYFHLFGRLPVEISRGCWWNKCSFCSQKAHHNKYREKKVDKIVGEIQFYSDKYMILSYQLIGNTLPKKDYMIFLEKIKELDKDFTFFIEDRAGELKNRDYALLKEAGFNEIQIGIETFSSNYIKKINKGVNLIDNIAALKFCKENDIKINYNIIINYPNEESIDFEVTKKNIHLLKQYLEPPQISFLAVEFGSNIYNNFEKYNIKKLEYTDIDKIMFPKDYLEKDFCFLYNFKRKKNLCNNNWEAYVDDWKNEYYKFEIDGVKRQTIIDKFVFYYLDGKNFLKIYDKRNIDNIKIYILDDIERKIFLSCLDVISLEKLYNKLPDIAEKQLISTLERFEKCGIVFREDNNYLSLPLCYDIVK